MISQALIKETRKFAYSQDAPSTFQLDLANEKGQWLAKKLKADKDIVLLGTLLMDCLIGQAIKEGRIKDHIQMSAEKSEEILSKYPSLNEKQKENILSCVRQHHGAREFSSLEAEICCNADCYRFAYVRGFLGALRYTTDMELDDLIELLRQKSDEKWHALTLPICKKELEPQYRIIKEFLSLYR